MTVVMCCVVTTVLVCFMSAVLDSARLPREKRTGSVLSAR